MPVVEPQDVRIGRRGLQRSATPVDIVHDDSDEKPQGTTADADGDGLVRPFPIVAEDDSEDVLLQNEPEYPHEKAVKDDAYYNYEPKPKPIIPPQVCLLRVAGKVVVRHGATTLFYCIIYNFGAAYHMRAPIVFGIIVLIAIVALVGVEFYRLKFVPYMQEHDSSALYASPSESSPNSP